jgi:hypothetical protein
LPPDQLRALADDIKAHGIQTHIVVWDDPENGRSLLDGISRLDAAALAGVLVILEDGQILIACDHYYGPVDQRCIGPNDGIDPYALVISLNIHRRHLDSQQKRDLIDRVLKATPEKTDRQIAKETKTSPTTVGRRRKRGEKTGEVSKVDTKTDKRGYKQPAHRPARKSARNAKASDKPAPTTGNGGDPGETADAEKARHAAAEAAETAAAARGEVVPGPAAPADKWTAPPLPAVLQEWNRASEDDRKIACDSVIGPFFNRATGVDIANQILNFGREGLAEETLVRVASHIGNNGRYELAAAFFDTLGVDAALKSMSPEFEAALRDRLAPKSKPSKANTKGQRQREAVQP